MEILLTGSIFTGLGIYKKDLIEELKVSPNTITNYLDRIDNDMIYSNVDGNKTYYMLKLEYFDSRIDQLLD